VSGWGESLGERPRGDLVRWLPKVAPAWELGVVALLGAGNGPVCVGVIARADAAMGWRATSRSVGSDACIPVSVCSRKVSLSRARVAVTLGYRDTAMGAAARRVAHGSDIPVFLGVLHFAQRRRRVGRGQFKTTVACAASRCCRQVPYSSGPVAAICPGLVSRKFGVRLQVLFSQDEPQRTTTTGEPGARGQHAMHCSSRSNEGCWERWPRCDGRAKRMAEVGGMRRLSRGRSSEAEWRRRRVLQRDRTSSEGATGGARDGEAGEMGVLAGSRRVREDDRQRNVERERVDAGGAQPGREVKGWW
jgi:hypothetical protein